MRHAAGGSRDPPELDQGDGMHHQHGEQRRQDVKSHETRVYPGYANHPEHDLRAGGRGHHGHDAHSGPDSHGKHAGHTVTMFRDKFWVSLVLTVPTQV
jgi:Cu2+-exporting ATPase